MARRLIVDTGVLVSRERRGSEPMADVDEDDDLVIAAITVAELRTGVELAGQRHRPARSAFVRRVLEVLPVEPYHTETAGAHARLLAHVHRSGTRRGAHDLVVAATALVTGRTIVTTDARAGFADLPGVRCVVLS